MLKLRDWERVQSLAHIYAEELKVTYNIDVRVKPYTMYDGRKGIALQLFDKYGKFFKEYCSGIFEDINGYKSGLRCCYGYILNDI